MVFGHALGHIPRTVCRQFERTGTPRFEHRRRVVAAGHFARNRRALVSRDNERLGILYQGTGDTEPRELSWKD